jgi:hypothetical protein
MLTLTFYLTGTPRTRRPGKRRNPLYSREIAAAAAAAVLAILMAWPRKRLLKPGQS